MSKYIIYLDEENIEEFDSDEATSLKKYEEVKKEYTEEEIYDKITLVKCEIVKEDEL